MKCAYVEWVDSVHQEDWNEETEINKAKVKPEVSCGLLVKDEPTFITLALSYADETKEWGQVVSIPRVAIKNIHIFNKSVPKKKTEQGKGEDHG